MIKEAMPDGERLDMGVEVRGVRGADRFQLRLRLISTARVPPLTLRQPNVAGPPTEQRGSARRQVPPRLNAVGLQAAAPVCARPPTPHRRCGVAQPACRSIRVAPEAVRPGVRSV